MGSDGSNFGCEDNTNTGIIKLGLFITSLSLVVFQVVLTRLLSPMFHYHYVFLITSMAIFGSGLGGYITHKRSMRKNTVQLKKNLSKWLLLLAVSYLIVFSLIFKLPYTKYIYIYAALALFPYIIGGVYISSVFRIAPVSSYSIYFADLIGSALGGLAVIYFLSNIGLTNTVLLISGLTALSSAATAWLFNRSRFKLLPIALVLGIILTASLQIQVARFESVFVGYLTSPTTSLASLRRSNTEHSIIDSIWDAYSKTDLIRLKNDDDGMLVTMDGGSNSKVIKFDEDLNKYITLKTDLNYFPFEVSKQNNVLLIGPGGGRDVVLALMAGSKQIDAVEINRSSVELVRKYGEFTGNIYRRDNVNVHIQDGRNFVKETKQEYDIIYLAQVMTGTAEAVGYSLAENFIYTKEAVKDYWNALNEDGNLAVILHDQKDLNRMLYTVIESLYELGVPRSEIDNHIIALNRKMLNHGNESVIHAPLLMLQKSPFTNEQIDSIEDKASIYNHEILYLPGKTTTGPVYLYSQGSLELDTIYNTLPLNLKPTTDDSPFFFDYDKGISQVLLTLLIGVLIGALLFYKPLKGVNKVKDAPLFFMGLGLAYMLIEIPLIQKFTLFLGHPSRSFVIVMTALLLGSGLGSLAGGWTRLKYVNRYIPLLAAGILAIAVNIVATLLANQWFVSSENIRMIVTVVLLLPLGFFMGMPFPYGIKALQALGNEESIPLIWGMNGILSVGGSVLAIIASMKVGFTFAIALGSLIYIAMFVCIPLNKRLE